jgi:hypothetical protein
LKCNGAEVDKTTYANLYSVIGNQYSNNNIVGNGQPWKQQYLINSTQSNDITGWSADSSTLPNGLYYSQAIVTKNRVYMLGGWNGVYTNAVLTAPINADGTLGAWVAGTALPGIMSLSVALITKNRVYLIGAYTDNSVQVSTVYTAVVNADGTLGTWTTGTSLPVALGWSSGFITRNRVYICGGNTAGSVSVSTVYTASISSDGIIGTWTTGPSLPQAGSGYSCIVTKNRVYLLGSYQSNNIHTAVINDDGTIGNWTTSGSLPNLLANSQALVTKNRVYLLGGYNGSSYVSTVYTTTINSDGTLGTWEIGTSLPTSLGTTAVICTKNKIYLIGGQGAGGTLTSAIYSAPINGGLNDYSSYYGEDTTNYLTPGAGKPWQQQYQINTTQSTDITGWTSASSNLPGQLGNSQAVVTKNRVYLLGGNVSGTSVSTVYTAPINADGTLGNWTTGTILPSAISASQVIAFRNKVYIIGGSTANVYSADINADGTLGTWVLGTALPVIAGYGTAVITRNRIYIIGCYINSSYSGVTYTAPINSDGTLGTWTTGTTIPVAYCTGGVAITKNKIYYCGGWNGGLSNTVYYATINSDGFISSWSVHSTMPGGLLASQCIVTKNRLYMFGGFNGNTSATSAVYTAPIDDNGNLGTWTTGSSISIAIGYSASVITKNRIYLMGGNVSGSNVTTSVVITASISSGMNDYSSYFDGSQLGEVPLNNSDKFLLPDLSADEPFGSYSYIKY